MLPDSYLDGAIAEEREAHWRKLLSLNSERVGVFIASESGNLVGFVCVLLDAEPEWGARLDNIHVRPEDKGKGIGCLLFKHAAEWVMSQQPDWPLHLFVFEENHSARRFYEAFGGEVVERYEQKTIAGVVVPSLRFFWRSPSAIANM